MKQDKPKHNSLYEVDDRPEKIEFECFNPDCYENEYLLKSFTKRPITFLGSECWFCHTKDFLRILQK